MELQFLGGARTVTGSCFYLNTGHHKILVECGAFQGSREMEKLNYAEFPFDASEIDYVFLTHAHYDHVGRLPLLVSRGFRGKVFCTAPTNVGNSGSLEYQGRKLQTPTQRKCLHIRGTISKCIIIEKVVE